LYNASINRRIKIKSLNTNKEGKTMDIKNKIEDFLIRGKEIEEKDRQKRAKNAANGFVDFSGIGGQQYEHWMNEIEVISQRHLQGHPIRNSIHTTYFHRDHADAFEKMMGHLNALKSDDDIFYEHSALAPRKRISLPKNDVLMVLFFASNPDGVKQLSIDNEARMIEEAIRKSKHRDKVFFKSQWATQATDILQGINEMNPDIIHFSGHGTEENELVLQNSDGSPMRISKEAIAQVISTVSDKVKLVFFNSCFSQGQAEEIIKHIDSAIGMTSSITDEAACKFAAQFYSSLGFGCSLDKAFIQAKASLMLENIPEDNTPEIYCKCGLSASDIKLISHN